VETGEAGHKDERDGRRKKGIKKERKLLAKL
jgi:hypothetical protein